MAGSLPVPTILVVGGGASGTLFGVHLMRALCGSGRRARIVLLDRDGRHGLGQAYATPDPRHLLNAPVGRMSALAGAPEHLLDWARRELGPTEPTDFLARADYGRYLLKMLVDAERRSAPAVTLVRETGSAVAAWAPHPDRPAGVLLADGRRLEADLVVLATGNPPPVAIDGSPGPGLVGDPWAPGVLGEIAEHRRVLVVGTGLTMVDLAVSVAAGRPGAVIHAVSRRGLLPRAHREDPRGELPRLPELKLPSVPARLGTLIAAVRAEIDRAGGDWRGVLDAMRPLVPGLWAGLPAGDQARFVAQLARIWEVHRHRLPPATAAVIARLRAADQLQVHQGRLVSADPHPGGGRRVVLDTARGPLRMDVDVVVNGTGPGSTAASTDPLAVDLLRTGSARSDHLGLGLDVSEHGNVRDGTGRPQPWLLALGPPLRGVRWETTAIPEIRDQAGALADRVRANLVERAESACPCNR